MFWNILPRACVEKKKKKLNHRDRYSIKVLSANLILSDHHSTSGANAVRKSVVNPTITILLWLTLFRFTLYVKLQFKPLFLASGFNRTIIFITMPTVRIRKNLFYLKSPLQLINILYCIFN